MSEGSTSRYLQRAADRGEQAARHVRHPFNPASDVTMIRLSDPTGMKHLGVSLARVPPGKESFVLHAHTRQEEWVYVLEGRGHAQVGEHDLAIEPGDFLGFPADGTPHVIRNTSDADLVFLQGGDRRAGDRGVFPTLGRAGKVGYEQDGHMALVDRDAIELVPFSAWMADD